MIGRPSNGGSQPGRGPASDELTPDGQVNPVALRVSQGPASDLRRVSHPQLGRDPRTIRHVVTRRRKYVPVLSQVTLAPQRRARKEADPRHATNDYPATLRVAFDCKASSPGLPL